MSVCFHVVDVVLKATLLYLGRTTDAVEADPLHDRAIDPDDQCQGHTPDLDPDLPTAHDDDQEIDTKKTPSELKKKIYVSLGRDQSLSNFANQHLADD